MDTINKVRVGKGRKETRQKVWKKPTFILS